MQIATNEVIFREDLYPRFEPSPTTIQEYVEVLDVLPPIEVNQRYELIDGFHRWTAHKASDIATIEVVITETGSDLELEWLAFQRNSAHGLQYKREEKQSFARRHYNGKNAKDLAARMSVTLGTVKRWVKDRDAEMRRERERTIRNMWLACHTQQEIADAVEMTQQNVALKCDELQVLDKWEKFVIFAEHRDPDWSPPLYNVWTFGKKGNKVSHFGNSEQRIVDNLLYMFTEPFDIVVDPFAGGGSTIDVCKHRLRRYFVSDRLPIVEREHEIRTHEIADGPPPLHKRWQDVALVYLDPPYWRQSEGEYSQDDADLANMPLEEFYKALALFVEQCAEKMRSGSHIALLIQPTQWKADDRHYPEDHVLQLISQTACDKLRYKSRVICPYQTEQYNPQQVEWAKEHREVLTLNRELIVWSVT